MSRPDRNLVYLAGAALMSTLGTCARRQVGCVMVDQYNQVLATGYNGVPPGFPHCREGHVCEGALNANHGTDACRGIHAEENAVSQCKDNKAVRAVYCTDSPCKRCAGLLLTTGIKHLYYYREYDGGKSLQILRDAGVEIHLMSDLEVQRVMLVAELVISGGKILG